MNAWLQLDAQKCWKKGKIERQKDERNKAGIEKNGWKERRNKGPFEET